MMRCRSSCAIIFIIFLNVFAIESAIYSPGGPVYVNPNEPAIAPVVATNVLKNENYVTQTVYGFLDFTTTIGNTVMIFSPQSEAPAPTPSTPSVEIIKSTVVTELPSSVVTPVKQEIKPTKTTIASIVQVVAGPSSVVSVVNVKPPKISTKVEIISTHVEIISDNVKSTVAPTPAKSPTSKKDSIKEKILSSHVEVKQSPVTEEVRQIENIESSIVEVSSSENTESVLQIANNIGEPEYDFLSRQPSEFVEETFRVVNLKSSNPKFSKPRLSTEAKRPSVAQKREDTHPTGLVTKLGGTLVKDGATTVHETSVIGTYISGKYAQVLQSTSHIFHNNVKPKLSPSPSLRILKTAAPALPKANRHVLEPTPTAAGSDDIASLPVESLFGNSANPVLRSSRKPATSSGSFKNRFRNRSSKDNQDVSEDVTPAVENNKKPRNRSNKKSSRYGRPSSTNVELATVSVFSETSTPHYSSRRNKPSRHNDFKPSATVAHGNDAFTRRGYKPKPQPTAVDQDQQSTSLYKFKLNRTPGRWQYKTTPKPRVPIRKNNDEIRENEPKAPIINEKPNDDDNVRTEELDLASSPSINGDILNDEEDNGIDKPLPVETLKIEISTPADFKDTYYEIATIKSPYTFQVGTVKNTRYITVTSTLEKTLDPEPTTTTSLTEPLTENILATTSHIDKEHNLLDSTIATLPAIYMSSSVETPSLETLTETFSTTHVLLKTHILPIIYHGNSTESHTLIQTYHVTRLVTATKTLPPMELYQFVPSKTLNEFNSRLDEAGSELHLELEFGDDNDEDEDEPPRRELPPDLDLSNIGSEFDLSDVERRNIPANIKPKKKNPPTKPPQIEITTAAPSLSPEQLQQLALLRLLNPAANIPQVITTSKPVIKLETVYESHIIPIFNGVSTSYSTISRPVATVSKTEYELGTSTLPPTLPIPQPINPLFPQQQQFQITSTPVITETVITQTNSKILKLTFGAKTAYTTLFSTQVIPTVLTTFVTGSVPLQATAAFPGYFPAPYPPFPYVG